MRNHYQALSDCAIRIAIAHESKEQNAIKNGDSATAEKFTTFGDALQK